MKRLHIMIGEDRDVAFGRPAAARDTSKAALIPEYVRERIQSLSPLAADPIARMAGADEFEPAPVDDVVYR